MIKLALIPFVIMTWTWAINAQPFWSQLTADHNYLNQKSALEQGVHTSIQPFADRYCKIGLDAAHDSTCGNSYSRWFKLPLVKDNRLNVSPIATSMLGFSSNKSEVATQQLIGLHAQGAWGGKLFLQLDAAYAASRLAAPYKAWAKQHRVLPHEGRYHRLGNQLMGSVLLEGSLTYAPVGYFDVTAGVGKNFLGNGYRSLFLSDNSAAYPHLKLRLNFERFNYLVLYNYYSDVDYDTFYRYGYDDWTAVRTPAGNNLRNKFSTTHYLSVKATEWLDFNIFESIIINSKDSIGNRGFDVNFVNPIIFYRPVEFNYGSMDNALMGVGANIRYGKHNMLYAQFLLDELLVGNLGQGWWGEKYAVQVGTFFWVKSLRCQLEANLVRPYTYSHKSSMTNYGNAYQALAHPLGSNFKEGVFKLDYRHGRFSFHLKNIVARYGLDTDTLNVGKDIYKSYFSRATGRTDTDFGNTLGQGLSTTLRWHQLKACYHICPKQNMQLELGIRYREEKNALGSNNDVWVFAGLRTLIFDRRFDY